MTDSIDRGKPRTISTEPPAAAATPATPAPAAAKLPPMHRGAKRADDTFFGFNTHFPFWRGNGCADKIGWLAKEQPPGPDVSKHFEALNRTARADKPVLPANADDFVYLFVGGIFSHLFPDALYLQENIEALRAAGLTASRVDIDSTTGVETNAKVVRDAVLRAAAQSGKKVVLIGHSKGGLDSAAAIATYPEVAAVTRALITIQSPYAGSPVAQDIADDPMQQGFTDFLLTNLIDGKKAMARDLTYDVRRKFVAAHPLPPDLDIVSAATTNPPFISSTLASHRYILDRYGRQSDGLVLAPDAWLPRSRRVLIKGLDHMGTIAPSFPRGTHTPASITLALVALTLGG